MSIVSHILYKYQFQHWNEFHATSLKFQHYIIIFCVYYNY